MLLLLLLLLELALHGHLLLERRNVLQLLRHSSSNHRCENGAQRARPFARGHVHLLLLLLARLRRRRLRSLTTNPLKDSSSTKLVAKPGLKPQVVRTTRDKKEIWLWARTCCCWS